MEKRMHLNKKYGVICLNKGNRIIESILCKGYNCIEIVMKVIVDRDTCIGCELCVGVCLDIFKSIRFFGKEYDYEHF